MVRYFPPLEGYQRPVELQAYITFPCLECAHGQTTSHRLDAMAQP
jgi:hypothetical protein